MFAIILGTRPEIIKMSPLIRLCEKQGIDYFVLHTGQHYSYEMDRVFFEDLRLPAPRYNIDVGSGSHAVQTGAIMAGVEKILTEEKPDVVLVQGDTNTVLAGTLAASKCYVRGPQKLPILVGHVEAGLRSCDRTMPEEINRIIADHVADYCFAPTDMAKENLLHEGIDEKKIVVTGNTIVDAVRQNVVLSNESRTTLPDLGLSKKGYFLVTLHRQENVDDKKRLEGIFTALARLHAATGIPMVFPVHPRTEKMIASFGLDLKGIRLIPPQGFLDFLQLESNARMALTDSGGVQEETCILGVPCVTIRDSTERPETVAVGANLVAGVSPDNILKAAGTMLEKQGTWKNPFGDGNAGERIIAALGSRKQ
jgi:UDP-N-acetylglucosamine 2-epimerase (non-hydrolysing)